MSHAAAFELLESVRNWIAQDPDTTTRQELESLVATATDSSVGEKIAVAAVHELMQRFSGTLEFGTAGLRAELGAGPMRMNRVVVQRAAAGIARYIHAALGRDLQPAARAVIGYDARKNSAVFAQDTAAIFTAAGVETFIMPQALPTPVLAWAVKEYQAEIGVMVTASHNPATDNGYKIYLGGRAVEPAGRGAQIVPPYDAEIAADIAAVGDIRDIAKAPDGWNVLPTSITDDYLHAILPEPGPPADSLKIVFTAMHGVGGSTTMAALARAGFTHVYPVAEQHHPDPTFPTVTFPNPEEPGALDLALATACDRSADLVIANDPDADRCAVAISEPSSDGAAHWRVLRGDDVGALLGAAALDRLKTSAKDAVVANSLVSSRLLERMAAAHGVKHQQTLTGFKWIARVPGLFYGYEEALGYCLNPEIVSDKDGISAAVAIAQLARQAKEHGSSLAQQLDQIALRYGLFTTDQLSVRVTDLAAIPHMMRSLREDTPTTLGGSQVVVVHDLAHPTNDSALPPTDGMLLLTEDDTRVIIRPSGTEPKLKCYVETVAAIPNPTALPTIRTEQIQRAHRVCAELKELLCLPPSVL